MKKIVLSTLLGALVSTFAQIAPADAARCNWTVEGKVQVRESLTDPSGTTMDRGLKSIDVKVSGATVGHIYNSWGTVHTDSNGNFSLTKTKNCSKRYLKVQIRLKHSELKVKNPSGGEWVEIYETGSKRNSGTLDIGTKRFTDGSGTTELNSNEAFRRALAWYATKKVIDTFQSEDSYFDFNNTITVKYPANVAFSSTSYANGVERTAFVDPTYIWSNRGFLETVIHEVMHLWNYDHNSGMTNWLAAILGDSSTHSFQENPNVAYHEGFAEYAMEDIFHEIWGWDKIDFMSRTDLDSAGLTSPSILEGNDDGVRAALHLLTAKNLYPSSTFMKTCRNSPNITFWDVLSVFEESPSDGYSTEWPVGSSSVGVLDFFERSADILNHFTDDDLELYLDLLDADGTGDENDACSARTWGRSRRF